MRTTAIATALLAIATASAGVADAQTAPPRTLQLTFEADQRVSLSAANVTVVEILAEWARRCSCYVVNANRLTGAPLSVPIQFEHATQAQVLESLLRPAAGYVLTPNRSATGVSSYETIYIIAASTASAPPTYSSSYGAAVPVPITTIGAPDDEIPPVVPDRSGQPPAQSNPRPSSGGVSVPPTTVAPFGSAPPSAPARGGGPPPPPPR